MRILCAWMVCGLLTAGPMFGQQAETKAKSWQEAAGGKMSFEVASVRPSGPDEYHSPGFPLSPDDFFRDPGGRFQGAFALEIYIEFAYKTLPSGAEVRAFEGSLPEWAKSQRYTLLARAPLGATKDQYRLMMQDLLAERFGLRLHIEQRDEPVFLMTLEKPGQPGPKLVPHDKGVPCDTATPPADVFPRVCGGMVGRDKDEMVQYAARAISLNSLGESLARLGAGSGQIDRTPVDETGLTGLWDFSLTLGRRQAKDDLPNGPTLLEAVHDQLGLKLKPARRVQPVLIVDHVERPSEN